MTMQQGPGDQTTGLEGFDPIEDMLGGLADERRTLQGDDAGAGADADDLDLEGDEDLDEGEGADEQGDDEGDAEGTEKPATPETRAETITRYATQLANDPTQWSKVPTRYRNAAIEESLRLAVDYGRGLGRSDMAGRVQESAQIAAMVAEKDALAVSDPDGFADWQTDNPGQAAAYWASKARIATASDPSTQAAQEINRQAREATAPLVGHPEALEVIRARMVAGEYPGTTAGLMKLSRDVGTELAKSEASKGAVEGAATERSRAATRRRGIARPLAVGAGGAGSRTTVALEDTDHIALAMEGFREERVKDRR